MVSKKKAEGMSRVDELGFMRIELDNLIGGREISKAAIPESWSEEDERELALLKRIASLLSRTEVADGDE